MVIIKAYLSLILYCLSFALFSQSGGEWSKTDYAKEVITVLTSESLHGRGYVNKGDQLAAEYLQKQFKKYNLKFYGENYYQSFTFPINTFPGTVKFLITGRDNKKKKSTFEGRAGVNMLIGAGCPMTKGTYNIVIFDSTYTVSEEAFNKFKSQMSAKACFVLVDDRGVNDKYKQEYFKKAKANFFKAEGIIEFTKKLTHTLSRKIDDFRTVKLLTDSFNIAFSDFTKLKIFLDVENKFIDHATQNVIGYVQGTLHPDSCIVFSAHYDHLGQLGKDVYFPGANDNASGCAMLLNLARYYSMKEHQPDYTMVFIAFAGEEAGLVGSEYYVNHPLFSLTNIRFLLNMDIMGTGDEGITVVNGTLFKNEFEKLVEINRTHNYLKEVKIRGKAANSDHYPFSEKEVKAFFIYTMGGIKAYHDLYDKVETLPLSKFEELFKLITRFGDYLQGH